MDAKRVEHRTKRTAGDDARPDGGWTQNDLSRAVTTVDIVMQRTAFAKRNTHESFLGGFRRLAYGFRHFARLAVAEADAAFLVAHDDEGRKAEPLTALHNLRDAIDVNELVDEFAALAAIPAAITVAPTTATVAVAAAAAAAAWLFGRLFFTGHRSESSQNFRPLSRAASPSALTRP